MKIKKISTLIITAMLGLMLVGCADDHYGEYALHQAKVDDDNKALAAQYFAAAQGRDALVMSSMGEKGDSSAMVLYSVLQGQRDAQVISAFKSSGLKAPTTGMDVWNTFMANTVPTAVKWGFGYMLGSDLLDALGAAKTVTTVGGDYVNTTNTLTTGSGDISDITNSLDYSKTDNSQHVDITGGADAVYGDVDKSESAEDSNNTGVPST